MERIALFLIALLVHGASHAAPHKPSRSIKPADETLRYDGVYRTLLHTPGKAGDAQQWQYLRFYKYNKFVAVRMSGQLEDVQKWFDYGPDEKQDISHATVHGDHIEYYARSSEARIDTNPDSYHVGRIGKDRLSFALTPANNKRGKKTVYTFVKMHDLFRDCVTPGDQAEDFDVFYARFAHDEQFALSRTPVPLLTRPVPESSPPISEWDMYVKERHLPRRTRAVNSQSMFIAMWDTAYFFWREEKCWVFVYTANARHSALARTPETSVASKAQTNAVLIESLHTTRNRRLYYNWNTLPDNLRELGQRSASETIPGLTAAFLADTADPLFRFNIVMLLSHILEIHRLTETEIEAAATCLLVALKDPSEFVRTEAVTALRFTKDSKYEPAARALLDDPDFQVRNEAEITVTHLGGKK